jgi:hypothetical protein
MSWPHDESSSTSVDMVSVLNLGDINDEILKYFFFELPCDVFSGFE